MALNETHVSRDSVCEAIEQLIRADSLGSSLPPTRMVTRIVDTETGAIVNPQTMRIVRMTLDGNDQVAINVARTM